MLLNLLTLSSKMTGLARHEFFVPNQGHHQTRGGWHMPEFTEIKLKRVYS